MPLDQETIDNQLNLLATHRRTLAHLLQQAAQFGGEVFAPPQTANGIAEARAEIARSKAGLREGRVEVVDEPNDDALPAAVATLGGEPAATGPRVQSTINVTENKGTVIGTQIINQARAATALHQLRAPVGDFVGRTREIDKLVLALSATNNGATATIAVVRGMGGTGKSELAYAVARQLRDAFTDAQLLVELRGAIGNPLTPEQTLQTVIRAFDREAKLPDDLGQLKGLYNAVLTGKRVLILADDARDAAQVRSLPPPPGCVLLVTSRNRFSLPGMAALDLGMLPPGDAEKLVLKICPRIGEHAAKLAKLCGYLPLALRVSASLLETNDARDVAHYLEQLTAERLKYLSGPDDPDDPVASVEASLRLSYNALDAAARAALEQLSVFVASFDPAAAQAVVEVEDDVMGVLELLRRRSLLEWDAKLERYSLHDLVRAFAAARLEDGDAVGFRYARYYARIAFHAQNDLYLKGNALVGLRVFDSERTHIDAGRTLAMAHAGDPDADRLLCDYRNALYALADLRYDTRRERIPQLEAQRAAAQRLGRRVDEGLALVNLGSAYSDLGDVRKAIAFSEQALVIAREIGDRRGEGHALGNLGLAYADLGDVRQAIEYYEQDLVIARELGDRQGDASASWNLGLALEQQGDLARAAELMQVYVDFLSEIGHSDAEKRAAEVDQLRQRLAGADSGPVAGERA